jgi:beta-lactamase regulating signal transducer with metallopeptidase domain
MDTWIYVAGWTLVHFVWQGAVIGAGAAVGLYLLRRATSNIRYVFASAALILMLLSLVVTGRLVSSPVGTPIAAAASLSSSTSPVLTSFVVRFIPQLSDSRRQETGTEFALRRLPRVFPAIVIAWLTGVALLLARLLSGWWRVRALQRVALTAPPSRWQETVDRLARRLGIRRRVRVTDTETVETPTVIGWWRPVIVLPMVALSGLTPSQADAILMHELAHIRRHDYLVNLLQHVTETVLFYHPAVWWLSHRMRVEREQCCDGIVVDQCADPLDYATALTRLEEARQPATGLAVAATGGRLVERVRYLLGARTDHHTTGHTLATATIIALVVLVVGGGYQWSTRMLHAADRGDHNLEATTRPALISSARNSLETKRTEVDQVQKSAPTKVSVSQEVGAERQRENVLPGNPANEMSIAAELNYFQLNRAEYSVPVSVRIPGSELALARTGGAARTTIDITAEVKDDYGTTLVNLHDKLEMALSDDSVAQFANRPIQYETSFTLLPGRYVVTIQARDIETERIGTFETSFTIPNLNKVENQIPISTVVLGSQLVRINDDGQKKPADPLVHDGLKLIPSVTRVFSKTQDMYIFLQAYEHDATTTQPLVAFVTLYRGGVKAFETAPWQVTDGLEPRSKAVPLQFAVPLGGLAPGRYECQVTVLDPGGQKVTSWRAPVELVP